MSVGCSFCRARWEAQGWEGHCPHLTPEVLASEMARQEERIRTLEAALAQARREGLEEAARHMEAVGQPGFARQIRARARESEA